MPVVQMTYRAADGEQDAMVSKARGGGEAWWSDPNVAYHKHIRRCRL